jgi:hypothetical protein
LYQGEGGLPGGTTAQVVYIVLAIFDVLKEKNLN